MRKFRAIKPSIRAGADVYTPLGEFYSNDWQINDGTNFVTCTAFDILYSLKNIIINYGMDTSEAKENGLPIKPYMGQKISDVITRVFKLINDERKANGIFADEIEAVIKIKDDFVLPYVLIEEKSAWDVLQDIANLCCAYIYVDRNAKIVIEEEDYEEETLHCKKRCDVCSNKCINPKNAFSYNLPASSKTVVNQVNAEYYVFGEGNTEDNTLTIKKSQCKIIDNEAIFDLPLKNFYQEINSISEYVYGYKISIISSSFNKLRLKITFANSLEDEFNIKIGSTKNEKLIKEEYTFDNEKSDESIVKYGFNEYSLKANTLLFGFNKSSQIANRLINKFNSGLNYVITEWKGNNELELSDKFFGLSQYEENGKTFECLSNEMVLSNGFRQKTKGRN